MEHSVLGLRPGSVVQDTYRIDSLLGEGGMAATFLATNLATGHKVAIKVMGAAFSANKKAVELFRRESTLLRTVRNDAVIGYETTLMDAEGRLYLVMEYVEGKPLADYVRKGLRLKPDDVLALGARLAGGLSAIHALGIVHRDIAPDNILIPHEDINEAKLIDFGLASDTVGTDQSIIGDSFAGKLSYCAPEQLGLFGNKARPATDAYALGLVLTKTAGLPVPGEGKGFAALDDRRNDIKVPPGKVPPPLARVLEHLLRANPDDRPADLTALFSDARAALAKNAGRQKKPAARPVPVPDRPQPGSGSDQPKSRAPLFAGVAAVVAIVAGLGLFALNGGFGTGNGGGGADVEAARDALAADDPLREITALIDAGGTEGLNAALGGLLSYQRDETNPTEARQSAAIMVARMYDPSTFDATRSPFDQPNPSAARRYYQFAADLGSSEAQDALARLPAQ